MSAGADRWSLNPHFDDSGNVDGCLVRVETPRGTGRAAYGLTWMSPEFAELDYRRAMAFAVRRAREQASRWRLRQLDLEASLRPRR